MKFKDIFRVRVSVYTFVIILFLCGLLGLTLVDRVSAEHWDGCGCPYPGTIEPQQLIFVGDMPCEINFVWCSNCEPDIAGYQLEYQIVDTEPTELVMPDDYNNPWPGVGLIEGESPIVMWNPGMKPTTPEHADDIELTDKDRPELRLTGLIPGKYYIFTLRARDTEGFLSDQSDQNAGYTVCESGPGAITDLIIKF